jgi:hypothetical protein
MPWDSEPRPEDPSGLGCSQQDFETMRVGAVLDLFFVELRISICSLLAEIQKYSMPDSSFTLLSIWPLDR